MMRLPSSVSVLGKGLDIKYEAPDGEIRKINTRGLAVCEAPDRRTLFLWPMPTKKHSKPVDAFPQAAEMYRTWTTFDPDEVLEGRPRPGEKTVRLGIMISIGYRADKWSRKRIETDYEHTYKSAVVLSECGDVLRIRGGRQQITAAGIRD